jgi:hypothetical protein
MFAIGVKQVHGIIHFFRSSTTAANASNKLDHFFAG